MDGTMAVTVKSAIGRTKNVELPLGARFRPPLGPFWILAKLPRFLEQNHHLRPQMQLVGDSLTPSIDGSVDWRSVCGNDVLKIVELPLGARR